MTEAEIEYLKIPGNFDSAIRLCATDPQFDIDKFLELGVQQGFEISGVLILELICMGKISSLLKIIIFYPNTLNLITHSAISLNNIMIVSTLMFHKDFNFENALHFAIFYGRAEITKLVCKKISDKKLLNKEIELAMNITDALTATRNPQAIIKNSHEISTILLDAIMDL